MSIMEQLLQNILCSYLGTSLGNHKTDEKFKIRHYKGTAGEVIVETKRGRGGEGGIAIPTKKKKKGKNFFR